MRLIHRYRFLTVAIWSQQVLDRLVAHCSYYCSLCNEAIDPGLIEKVDPVARKFEIFMGDYHRPWAYKKLTLNSAVGPWELCGRRQV